MKLNTYLRIYKWLQIKNFSTTKVVDCIENYNFGIDHINIQLFENLKFKI
jgi:hypothetical protein